MVYIVSLPKLCMLHIANFNLFSSVLQPLKIREKKVGSLMCNISIDKVNDFKSLNWLDVTKIQQSLCVQTFCFSLLRFDGGVN
jgi:hypothetical protein